jgi:hypothetical protein
MLSDEIHGFIAKPSEGMNTSVTKVIDNAILGFTPAITGKAERT